MSETEMGSVACCSAQARASARGSSRSVSMGHSMNCRCPPGRWPGKTRRRATAAAISAQSGIEHVVHLGHHDVFVVPRGTEHCPASPDGAAVLLLEPTGTLSTGDYEGEIPNHITSTTGLPT